MSRMFVGDLVQFTIKTMLKKCIRPKAQTYKSLDRINFIVKTRISNCYHNLVKLSAAFCTRSSAG